MKTSNKREDTMITIASIRLDKQLKKQIERYAKQNKIAFSQAVRLLANKALKHEQECEHQEVFTNRGW